MKKGAKYFAVTILTGAMVTSFAIPSFAEGYSSNYSYGNYNQQGQSYTPNYQQNYNNYNQGYMPAYNQNQNYNQNSAQSYPINNNQTTPSYNQNYSQNTGQNYSNYSLPALQGRVVTVPQGTWVQAMVPSSISSEFVTVGDTVSVMLGSGFYFNNQMILPPNTRVQGNVVVAEKAGLAGKHGKLKVRFTNAITPNGQRIPLSGKLATEDGTGMLIGGTGKERAVNVVKDTATGAGVGALLGTIWGAIMPGSAGKGAAAGTAIGGTLGAMKTVKDKGNEAVINAGSNVNLILEEPMVVNPAQNTNQPYNGYTPGYNY